MKYWTSSEKKMELDTLRRSYLALSNKRYSEHHKTLEEKVTSKQLIRDLKKEMWTHIQGGPK